MKNANGWNMVSRIVCGSSTSIDFKLFQVSPPWVEPWVKNSNSESHIRRMLNSTAAALKSVPSWNFTPSRKLMV